MLTVTHEGKSIYEARTFKLSKSLNNKRTAMKLEIERRYYASKGINWKIVTEKDISKLMVKNIEWIHSAYNLEENQETSKEDLHHMSEILRAKLAIGTSTVGKVANNLDIEMNVEAGTSLYLFRHLVAKKLISVNMSDEKPLTSLLANEIKFD